MVLQNCLVWGKNPHTGTGIRMVGCHEGRHSLPSLDQLDAFSQGLDLGPPLYTQPFSWELASTPMTLIITSMPMTL